MKKYFVTGLFIFMNLYGTFIFSQELPLTTCTESPISNPNFSKAKELQDVLRQIVNVGVPGCSMAVLTDEGWWTGSAGFAKVEEGVVMQACHLQYIQSVSKTYLAVGILRLFEMGKIDMDTAITTYLPEKYSRYLATPGKITVRMLLSHTSGVPEYNLAPSYIAKLLQHPDHLFEPEDYLKYIEGKPLDFVPGSRYAYRNTNFLLLALMAEAITGNHARFLSEIIFKPLGLVNTFYRNDSAYLTYPQLVNAYWDRHSNGIIENASLLQRNNVASLLGDDGIVTTPEEAVKFLKGLMEGKLIKLATLEIMKTWVKDRKGMDTYGLGLDYTVIQGQPAFGHSGGGIGAGCQLYYFPSKNVYCFIGINLGTVTDSPLQDAAKKSLEKVYEILLR